MASQRILITGGAGFIGSHLVRRLISEGHQAHILHRPNACLRRLEDLVQTIKLWECDLLDSDRLLGVMAEVQPEVIFHLAGDTSLRHIDASLSGARKGVEHNVLTSLNLFVAAQAHSERLSMLIRLGGLEEYGRGPVPYVESQREQPVSPYSASQVAVTHYLQMLSPHLSFRTMTVRPALIYGPEQSSRFFIPSLIQHCLEGRDFCLSSGSHGRDLLYIDDLVSALTLLLERPFPGSIILNIGSEREYIISDVARTIIDLTGATIRLGENVAARPSEIEHLYCSAEKARDLLGWKPLVNLEEGLGRTIESFRRQSA